MNLPAEKSSLLWALNSFASLHLTHDEQVEQCDACGSWVQLEQVLLVDKRFVCRHCANSCFLNLPPAQSPNYTRPHLWL